MRLSKYKAPWLALVLELVVLVLSFVLLVIAKWVVWPDWSSTLSVRILCFLYAPAGFATFLCLPDSSFEKGMFQPVQILVVFLLFALVQWYFIFLGGIGVYRHFYRKTHENIPAA
jgi:hypothetical protein